MPSSVGAMMTPSTMSKSEANRIAKEMTEKYKDTRGTDDLVHELTCLGFYPCQKIDITVGGNL